MDQRQGPAAAGTADTGQRTSEGTREHSATAGAVQAAPRPRKWTRMVQAFLDVGPLGLNRFQSAREYRDHVLPTTVSQIEARGVKILRRDETLQGYYGPVTVCRYWIDPASVERARQLIEAAP